jgi:acyl-CoA synthetase (AMP-forming)/AMP-acid ligase II/acyl carrier protein
MTIPGQDDPTARLLALGDEQPDAPAFTCAGRAPMTFGELARRVGDVGARLAQWGFARGDVIVWPDLDRPIAAAAQAIMPTASTLVPLSASATAEACADLLRRVGAKAIAMPRASGHPIEGIAARMGIARLAVLPDAQGGVGAFDLELEREDVSLREARQLSPAYAYLSATSGSTGRPKLVPHGRRQLMAMTQAIGERLALGPGDVSAHLQPLHLANGMRPALMVPLLRGCAVEMLAVADVRGLLDSVARGRVTFVTASFSFHRELLARIDDVRRAAPGRLRFVRVASGRLEAEEMDRLEAAIGVPVITALASTESGTVSHQGLPPALRIRGSVGPLLACEVRLVDERGHAVARGEVGEVQVRGPQVFEGYIDDPALDAASFVDGWFRMGDLGRFDDAGELRLVGRVKEQINRGGDKISPAEIDAVLRVLPGIADAAAFPIPHPRLGEEVVAAVVLAPGAVASEEELLGRAREVLGANRAPRRLWFVPRLPRTDGGKLRRADLPAWIGFDSAAARQPDGAAAAAMSPIQTALAALWASVLRLPAVSADADFFMLGGDSLRGAQLLLQVRAAFGVELPLKALFAEARTVAGMARHIEAQRLGAAST